MAFYRDALRGRQVSVTGNAENRNSLWFLVGRTLIEVGPAVESATTPIVVYVDDPDEVAERCWDAGFRVRARRDAAGHVWVLSVVDPLGRRVDLKASRSETSQSLQPQMKERRYERPRSPVVTARRHWRSQTPCDPQLT